MALTLGTNAYIELATWKAWADMRAHDYSAYSDAQIEGAIVIASVDYVDADYTFIGSPVSSTQPMQLPTGDVAIADIENAMGQAVWQQVRGQLLVDSSSISQSGSVKKTVDKLDVLEEEREYTEGTERTYKMPTGTIDRLLKPFVVAGGSALTGMFRV